MNLLCITILVRQMSWLMRSVGSHGEYWLVYNDQAQGALGSLVATPSLLSKVIESQGQDAKISFIRDRVQSGTGDEGWVIHTYGGLRYRGRVVVSQLIALR